jgi:hypothetical protein
VHWNCQFHIPNLSNVIDVTERTALCSINAVFQVFSEIKFSSFYVEYVFDTRKFSSSSSLSFSVVNP